MSNSAFVDKAFKEIDRLERAQAALEGYLDLIKEAGPRGLSKQAAAIMHTGLEHIDVTCGLTVRATGMESYDATPRSAMEAVNVDTKAIANRAREIGAKILEWIKKIFTAVQHKFNKLSSGVAAMESESGKVTEALKAIKGDLPDKINLANNPWMYLDKEFVGFELTDAEANVLKELKQGLEISYKKIVEPIIAGLRDHGISPFVTDVIRDTMTRIQIHNPPAVELPGNFKFRRNGFRFKIKMDNDFADRAAVSALVGSTGTHDVDVPSLSELRNQWERKIVPHIHALGNPQSFGLIEKIRDDLTKALVDVRKHKNFDEDQFKKIQAAISEFVKELNPDDYFTVTRQLVLCLRAKFKAYHAVLNAVNKSGEE
ncbi:internal head protein [Pseudomonas phage PhiPA3]|uniref:Virion structural protein n=1 Tax=Pseudomonas phage PhiPA3 TaxID=998086 RepID=F8SJX5_BPPA3|nr:internal head protein [Pseudomonas phage PhiPA3]AEH03521.1 virion structural protein [Pseudomonas phage PhiPA3]